MSSRCITLLAVLSSDSYFSVRLSSESGCNNTGASTCRSTKTDTICHFSLSMSALLATPALILAANKLFFQAADTGSRNWILRRLHECYGQVE